MITKPMRETKEGSVLMAKYLEKEVDYNYV